MRRRSFLKVAGLASAAAAYVSSGIDKVLGASVEPLSLEGGENPDAWIKAVRPNGDYNIASDDNVVVLPCSGTLTLPSPTSSGQIYIVPDVGAEITIKDGKSEWQVKSASLAMSNGERWFVMGA